MSTLSEIAANLMKREQESLVITAQVALQSAPGWDVSMPFAVVADAALSREKLPESNAELCYA